MICELGPFCAGRIRPGKPDAVAFVGAFGVHLEAHRLGAFWLHALNLKKDGFQLGIVFDPRGRVRCDRGDR